MSLLPFSYLLSCQVSIDTSRYLYTEIFKSIGRYLEICEKTMKRFMMSVTEEMFQKIEDEKNQKGQLSVQETVREIIADYFRKKE